MSTTCKRPSPGWKCKLPAGHHGPCPAWPTGFNRLVQWWRLR